MSMSARVWPYDASNVASPGTPDILKPSSSLLLELLLELLLLDDLLPPLPFPLPFPELLLSLE